MALDGRLMAVPIRLRAEVHTVEASAPVPLFLTHPLKAVENIDGPQYVVSPDGQRFLVNTVAEKNERSTHHGYLEPEASGAIVTSWVMRI